MHFFQYVILSVISSYFILESKILFRYTDKHDEENSNFIFELLVLFKKRHKCKNISLLFIFYKSLQFLNILNSEQPIGPIVSFKREYTSLIESIP